MVATKIKMKSGCYYSEDLTEIDSVYIDGTGFIKKDRLYDYLMQNPKSIYVNIKPYPDLIPAVSKYDEKYVKSEPDSTGRDNLLNLPRE